VEDAVDHRAGFRWEADRLLAIASRTDLDLVVPTCPDWTVADLLFHVGWVWDRFDKIVAGRLTEKEQIRAIVGAERPEDPSTLVDWARGKAEVLSEVLAGLGDDEPVWNFTRAPHVGAWVPRRMHHETMVHRWDLERVVGEPTPIDPDEAADGIDELVTVLSTAGKRWEGDEPVTLRVWSHDPAGDWVVRLEPGERAVKAEVEHADVTVFGSAADVFLVAWGRLPLGSVRVEGDPGLASAALAAIGR
jgi:uncharacterized protein (TIGR03083 family)